MAETYSFFDAEMTESGLYDRTYNSADMAKYFSSFVKNGVYLDNGEQLKVVAKTQNKVEVRPGRAWINGYFYELDEPTEVAIPLNLTDSPQWSSVVCRLDLSERVIKIDVITYPPHPGAEPPLPVRNDVIYDLVLAQVYSWPGSATVKQADITDTRPKETLCGWVAGVVNTMETEDLWNQLESKFNSWMNELQDMSAEDKAEILQKIYEYRHEVKPVEEGGTGRTSFTPRSLLVANPTGDGINVLPPKAGVVWNKGDADNNNDYFRVGTLPVDMGGTGATTPEQARKNLGLDTGGLTLLWEGCANVNASQTVNLSQKISKQNNGIILIWSGWNGNNNNPQIEWTNVSSTYIPKAIPALRSGMGFNCPIGGYWDGFGSSKYIYVYDDKLTGIAGNSQNGLGGFCLARVYGF